MKKLAIKERPASAQIAEVLAALPENALVAYHAAELLLYIRDDYAEATISYLAQAGISAEVVEP